MANRFEQFAPSGGGNRFQQFAPLAQSATFQKPDDEQLYQQQLMKTKAAFDQPRVPAPPEIGSPASPEQAAIEGVQRQRGVEQEKAAFDASRTIPQRAADTSKFLLSAPIRAATRGEYGIGDVVGTVSTEMKKDAEKGEADFAQANQSWLEPAAKAGEAAIGIPMLRSMGAAPGGIMAATRLARANQMMRGTPKNAAPLAQPNRLSFELNEHDWHRRIAFPREGDVLDGPAKISATTFEPKTPAGQFGTKVLSVGGEPVAVAHITRYKNGDLTIQRVETLPGAQRRGHATSLIDDALKEFPSATMRTTARTDAGRGFFAQFDDGSGNLSRRGGESSAPLAAKPEQAYGPAQRIADRAAFVDEGVPEFAPAFGSKGLARTAKTVEEAPLVGGTVKVPKNAVEQAMADRQAQIAKDVGAASSAEDVGLITQRGLTRFRGSNLEDLDRGTVQGFGIAPNRPKPSSGGGIRVDKPGQLDTSTMTDKQLDAARHTSNVELPGSTRTRVEELSAAEVSRIVMAPARDTSFATKASAIYKQADDAIATQMRANNSVNPGRLGMANSRNVVTGMLSQEARASIKGGVLEGRFGGLVERLRNPKSHMSLDDIRAARTEVGRALSNFGDFDARLDRGQLKQLYGALSDDYQAGLVSLAARARQASRLKPADPAYVAPSAANAADKALQRYRVADRYYRGGIERMDRFMGVLGAETLEQASRKIGNYLRENTQNIRALESMASSLRPEEWRAVLGNVIDGLGRLTPGSREAEKIFSFERYATDWAKISQNPRTVALFERSLGPEVVRSLNNMGRIAERMKYYETTKNYSASAYTVGTGVVLSTIWNPSTWPALIGAAAGIGITGKVLTSKWFATWVNSLNRAQMQVGSSVVATKQVAQQHLQRLKSLAAKEPDPEVAGAMAALGVAIEQQMEANRQ